MPKTANKVRAETSDLLLINISLDFVSGVVQGMVNGVRGLCNGLGPALFGFIFYLFDVNLNQAIPSSPTLSNSSTIRIRDQSREALMLTRDVPGPPFLFGALLATIALMFCLLLPNSKPDSNGLYVDTRTIEQKARLLDIEGDTVGQIST